MLPVIIILAIVIALSFLSDAWEKYHITPAAKARRKEKKKTELLKAPPSTQRWCRCT